MLQIKEKSLKLLAEKMERKTLKKMK